MTANDYYDDNIDRYEEARDEEFDRQFKDFYNETIQDNDIITPDDVQGFMDSFTFDNDSDWLANEYEGFLGGLIDQKYLAYKERNI